MKKRIFALAAFGVLSATSIAFAYTLSPDGTGFVGKGEDQTVMGWNNEQLQDNVADAVFTLVDEVTHSVICTKDPAGTDHGREEMTRSFSRTRGSNAEVAFEARSNKNGQVTGFNLTGFVDGEPAVSGDLFCPGGWDVEGEPGTVAASGGVLYANGRPPQ
jgi:hypothetical protein